MASHDHFPASLIGVLALPPVQCAWCEEADDGPKGAHSQPTGVFIGHMKGKGEGRRGEEERGRE